MYTLKDVLIIPNPLSSNVYRRASEEWECESNASVHDHECDEWYDGNIDYEECVVEETPLEDSCKMLVHEVSSPCVELIEFISPNPLDCISASLVHHPLIPLSMTF